MWRRVVVGLLLVVTSQVVQATIVSATLSHPGQSIQRKGHWYRFTLGQLPPDNAGKVTTLAWQIHSLAGWPYPPSVFVCRDRDCQGLDSVAGVSRCFAGQGSQGEWSIVVALPGTGALQPPILITAVSLTLNRLLP